MLIWTRFNSNLVQTCRLYKIQSGLAHCPTLKSKLVPLPPRQWHTHNKQLTLLTTRTQYRGSSFLPKTIRDWNLLPMKVVEAPTCDTFESWVSNWKTTYKVIVSPPPPPFLFIYFLCRTSTTVNIPSYSHQNNQHVDCGLLNERRRRTGQKWLPYLRGAGRNRKELDRTGYPV